MIETWFKILISAFVPVVLAFAFPAFTTYCLVASAVLFVTAMVVLVRQGRRGKAEETDESR